MAGISRYEKIALGVTAGFVLLCALLLAGFARGGVECTVTAEPTFQTPAAETSAGPDSLLPGEKINLNTAPAIELQRLPGIGEKRAADIVAWREANGGFDSIEELTQVPGIGEVTLNALRDHITINEE